MSEEYTGKDVSYYLVTVHRPKRLDPYTAECEDIIEALGMSFAEGCAFKAIWRKCAARTLGLAKAGYKGGLYDAEKTQYYGARMVAAEQTKTKGVRQDGETVIVRPENQRVTPVPEDVYVEFAQRALVQVHGDMARAAQQLAAVMTGPCSECGFPQNHEGTHYATCSALSAPAEHIEQAEAAFEEAAQAAPSPIIHNDMDEERVDIVASSHGDGEHYDDPWAGAPDWAKWKAQDADGYWYWYEVRVSPLHDQWAEDANGHGRVEIVDTVDDPNPNWRNTLIERPNNKSQE